MLCCSSFVGHNAEGGNKIDAYRDGSARSLIARAWVELRLHFVMASTPWISPAFAPTAEDSSYLGHAIATSHTPAQCSAIAHRQSPLPLETTDTGLASLADVADIADAISYITVYARA